MFTTKTVLVTTVLLAAHYILCISAGADIDVIATKEQQHNQNNDKPRRRVEDFKNGKTLMLLTAPKISIPDLVLLQKKLPCDNSSKYESICSLLAVWSQIAEKYNFAGLQSKPFTFIVPKIDIKTIESDKESLTLSDSIFMLEHIIPGVAFSTFNEEDLYGNMNGHDIVFEKLDTVNESKWTLNGFKILRTEVIDEMVSFIYIDGVLGDRKAPFSKRNIQETNRYNEPQRLEMKNVTKEEVLQSRKDIRTSPLMTFLSSMKSGTKVFQHFLTKSNLTQVLDDSPYTILIPSDNAFQRWHPIDWGFYPFSVQEFTEKVLRNHFLQLRTPLRLEDVMGMDRGHKYKTLGGEVVVFKNNPTPTVNNVSIVGDFTLPNGNEVFIISEVLFVSEAVVSRLHQMHKDKETPPLLAFPWFGAQFLSHSFLALERDNRFTQITRFLNTAEIAHVVSGANFTFFVPIDAAFEKLGFDQLSDEVLASEKGIKMLLNHFVRGRLYDRDLINNEVFQTIGGGAIRIQRPLGKNVTVNHANIVESEVFVYNLGTMFYIDEILYSDILSEPIKTDSSSNTKATHRSQSNQSNYKYSTLPDVEVVPSEFTEPNGTEDDLLQDDEIVTPRALPVKYNYYSPRK